MKTHTRQNGVLVGRTFSAVLRKGINQSTMPLAKLAAHSQVAIHDLAGFLADEEPFQLGATFVVSRSTIAG